MKVMVCLKQVPHQDARLDVKADGSWIQEDNIKFEINSYDTYAVEEALRLKDKAGAEVVVVSIGPDRVTQALRTALGMGADRAIHVNDPAAIGADALGTAKILAAIAKQENADVMRKNLSWQVTIEGHCDERGTAEYNLALGERRALAARAYLVSLGIPAERVRVVSYGKEFPFEPGHDEAAWSKNRRAHFVITAL